MKKVLILGGTLFIGRCLVEKLIERRDLTITLFNRGQTNPGLFPDVQTIIGDRETGDILQIIDQDWDFIIDISCYYPNNLRDLLPKLKGRVGRYIFVSTVSSYVLKDSPDRDITEENELISCTAQEAIDDSMRTYGKRKAECDRILLETDWLDKVILRPSIVYGKYDSTWRLYYWLYRIRMEASMIFPNGGLDRGNYAYVEDLANILIESMELAEHRITYNVSTHPVMPFTDFLKAAAASLGKKLNFVAVNSEVLELEHIKPVKDIPLWLNGNFLLIDSSKLLSDFEIELCDFNTSLEETISFYNDLGWPEPAVGLHHKKEQDLLEKLA